LFVKRILEAFPPTVVSHSAALPLPTNLKTAALIEPLTGREVQVLELLAQRRTDKEISAALVVAQATTRTHIQHVLEKLDVSNRRAAVEAARALGLLSAV